MNSLYIPIKTGCQATTGFQQMISESGLLWAIGTNYEQRNIFQLLFNYFSRNQAFWKHYQKDLRMEYVYFVKNKKVLRVPFSALLRASGIYGKNAIGKSLAERRKIADDLMKKWSRPR